MVSIRAQYSKELYSGDHGFCVALYKNIDTSEQFKVKGIDLPKSLKVKFMIEGDWEDYNGSRTLKLSGRPIILETSGKAAIINLIATLRYCFHGIITPIGRRLAKKIYRVFTEKSIERLNEDPLKACLIALKSEKQDEEKAAAMAEAWKDYTKDEADIKLLERCGLAYRKIASIKEKLKASRGQGIGDAIKENPYILIDYGAPLAICDLVAHEIGFPMDSDQRVIAGAKAVLYKGAADGHVFLYDKDFGITKGLISQTASMLSLDAERVIRGMSNDSRMFKIEKAKGGLCRVYLYSMYTYETGIAKILTHVINARQIEGLSENAIGQALNEYEMNWGITLAEKQRQAVKMALRSNVSIITGSPGTGKTTVLKAICEALPSRAKEEDIILLAPTGKAARRMSKAIGRDASTIHSRIGLGEEEDAGTQYLEAKLIIIDETSMCDVRVMYSLLSSIGDCEHLVFVGDVKQLPSVFAGKILDDLIGSGRIPVTRLDIIQRQAEDSLIVANAQRILAGDANLQFDNQTFRFIETVTAEETENKIVNLYCNTVEKLKTEQERQEAMNAIQLIIPMKKRICGAIKVNKDISDRLIKDSKDSLKVGDKVINLKNDYASDVNNGDMGYVISVSDDEVAVLFETGVEKVYVGSDTDKLALAYAITAHKAQGDEFDTIVVSLAEEQACMMYRNLIYTAITRAKKNVVMVGSKKMLAKAILTERANGRNSVLDKRLEYGRY